MFDIEFLSEEPTHEQEGSVALWGRAVIGEHQERFLAPLAIWQRGDYEAHWLSSAVRLLEGAQRTGFFTSAFQFWWTMWREGSEVYVQEMFLTPEGAEQVTDLHSAPYSLIPDRSAISTGGEQISEWKLSIDDLRDYAERARVRLLRA